MCCVDVRVMFSRVRGAYYPDKLFLFLVYTVPWFLMCVCVCVCVCVCSVLCGTGKPVERCTLLSALAEREEANRNGKMTTIIFIRDRNQRGQEVSGYIDYAHRLKVCIQNCMLYTD